MNYKRSNTNREKETKTKEKKGMETRKYLCSRTRNTKKTPDKDFAILGYAAERRTVVCLESSESFMVSLLVDLCRDVRDSDKDLTIGGP